ncbi:folylpolyglutamate synthase/dihydrofolate synthase family protein [uncultured Imperialibacter sp.]|uniref:bifunctional folylpolyglutamate synthase/dihydrofolate synthase n=1 Tax=uncultured Imperialibacter sp. TaxID=1672639 RepID=UPI0030DC5452|tara:strand:- start:2248 stop:3540 length:1293 start_codon:yes stop_codon:yes gene_type:complete
MTYQATLDYLYGSLPMFQRVGKVAIKKDLTNTLALCNALDNPHNKFKSVHIAGTNGKGTSAHSIAAILQAAGYKTGLYTSPHLKSFTERIRVNGEEMPEDKVVAFVERMKPVLEQVKPSFFETTVAMAFDHFASEQVDIAVVEVGLGGRLDSTNVINPLVSLITSISYDHMDLLGDTLEEIAGEKAGIIKKNTPVVAGGYYGSLDAVFIEKAKKENSPIVIARNGYKVENKEYSLFSRVVSVAKTGGSDPMTLNLDLTGRYYLKNLPGILSVVDVLRTRGFDISDEAVAKGLSNVKRLTGLKGRWQVLQQQPLMICDVGHNEEGMRELFEQLSENIHGQLHIVFGVVSDKDRSKLWSVLPKDAYYYFTAASIPRALPAERLYEEAKAEGYVGEVVSDVNEGIGLASKKAGANDVVFVGGSTFVVAEIDQL